MRCGAGLAQAAQRVHERPGCRIGGFGPGDRACNIETHLPGVREITGDTRDLIPIRRFETTKNRQPGGEQRISSVQTAGHGVEYAGSAGSGADGSDKIWWYGESGEWVAQVPGFVATPGRHAPSARTNPVYLYKSFLSPCGLINTPVRGIIPGVSVEILRAHCVRDPCGKTGPEIVESLARSTGPGGNGR